MAFTFGSALRTTFWSLIGRMWREQAPTRPHVQQVVELLGPGPDHPRARVADVGCGAGIYAIALAEAGFDVTGIDSATGMLDQARKAAPAGLEAHLRFERGNLDTRLPYRDSQFDVAIAISVIQATVNPIHASQEILRILKPGGILVVLHFERQAYHADPLWRQIRSRVAILKRKTFWNKALAAIKVIAERSGGSRYWSADELHRMLSEAGFRIESTPNTSPLIVVARRPDEGSVDGISCETTPVFRPAAA